MKRNNKKGFTIVELVVVIAIIAILAAVLIPTFASLIKRANVSSDQQLVRNLNTALIADAAINGKHQTMHDAVEALKASGFDVAKINDSKAADNEILWDSKNDLFCYLNGNTVEYLPENKRTYNTVNTDVDDYKEDQVNYVDLFRVASTPGDKFSTYLYGVAENESFDNVKTGIDVGNETVSAITYKGNGTAQNVVIRTNGGTLTINAATDDVKHYGMVKDLTVTAVNDLNCYHEFGYVGNLASFGTGKFVAEASAVFHQSKEEIVAILSGQTSELKDGSQYGKHYFDPENGVCEIDNCEEVDPDHPGGEIPSGETIEGDINDLTIKLDENKKIWLGDNTENAYAFDIFLVIDIKAKDNYTAQANFKWEAHGNNTQTDAPFISGLMAVPTNDMNAFTGEEMEDSKTGTISKGTTLDDGLTLYFNLAPYLETSMGAAYNALSIYTLDDSFYEDNEIEWTMSYKIIEYAVENDEKGSKLKEISYHVDTVGENAKNVIYITEGALEHYGDDTAALQSYLTTCIAEVSPLYYIDGEMYWLIESYTASGADSGVRLIGATEEEIQDCTCISELLSSS